MPGDDLVAQPSFNATRAITINAPPEAVWPWLGALSNDPTPQYLFRQPDCG